MGAERTPLETIRSQHLALHQKIRALEDVFAEPDGATAETARKTMTLLEGFDSALGEHFAIEEEGGYFADILKVAPRLSRRAAHLEQNHKEFSKRLEALLALVQYAIDVPHEWERVTTSVEGFLRALRAHEDNENELVREAFMVDLGRGD